MSALAQAAADLKQWQAAFDALIDQALPVLAQLGLRQQSSELEKQLRQLANLQQDWQHRQAQLKSLETAYLQSAQPERQQLKLKLLQAYADMLVQLPPLPSQLATPPSA
ncbi:MAG: hypothetical protein CVV27_08275 [Candidatus Melainabacteria bacterium HGW-Melainabacteria-1]|nr:MAG: hypothetical protein CVV27_08275 [Candidatus Melainabacteria bacterium HGW-Melainabacteria-1]